MNAEFITSGFFLLLAVLLPFVVFGVVFLTGRFIVWSRESIKNQIYGICFISLSYFAIAFIQGKDGRILNMALWIALGIGWAVYAIALFRRRT